MKFKVIQKMAARTNSKRHAPNLEKMLQLVFDPQTNFQMSFLLILHLILSSELRPNSKTLFTVNEHLNIWGSPEIILLARCRSVEQREGTSEQSTTKKLLPKSTISMSCCSMASKLKPISVIPRRRYFILLKILKLRT